MSALDFVALWLVPVGFFSWGYITYRIDMPRDLFTAIMYLFMCIIYLVPSWIMLRNNSLRGLLRYCFGLTTMPLFLVFLVMSIGWFSNDVPGFSQSYEAARNTYGGGKGFGILAVIPAAIACWLWYRFLLLIDGLIYKADKGESG